MVERKPAKVRSTVQKWAAGRVPYFLLGWLALAVLLADSSRRACRSAVRWGAGFLLGWLALGVLLVDGTVRWIRAAWAASGRFAGLAALILRRLGDRCAAGCRSMRIFYTVGDNDLASRSKRGKAKRATGKRKRRRRRGGAERGAARRNELSWGKARRRKVNAKPVQGGWRVAGGWVTGVCAAAGLGVLAGALTMQPARPPQPVTQAMPSQQGQGPGVGMPRAVPTKIEIPAIGVDASLLSLGVDDKDELAVPPLEHAELASWYNLGPSPGEPGSAVVVGHVDSAKIGPAVFFHLGRLKPGDVITVTRQDGTRPEFKVDSVQTYLKTSFPTQLVYAGEQATLRVITCGGKFDKETRNYLSNVVVFASLDT